MTMTACVCVCQCVGMCDVNVSVYACVNVSAWI